MYKFDIMLGVNMKKKLIEDKFNYLYQIILNMYLIIIIDNGNLKCFN